jgi:hypothetical protein
MAPVRVHPTLGRQFGFSANQLAARMVRIVRDTVSRNSCERSIVPSSGPNPSLEQVNQATQPLILHAWRQLETRQRRRGRRDCVEADHMVGKHHSGFVYLHSTTAGRIRITQPRDLEPLEREPRRAPQCRCRPMTGERALPRPDQPTSPNGAHAGHWARNPTSGAPVLRQE